MTQVTSSNNVIKQASRTIGYIGCGGAGVNVVRSYRENEPKDTQGARAQERFAYFDTSKANLTNVSADDAFLIRDLNGNEIDGSGSDRAANAEAIIAAIPEFIVQLGDDIDFVVVVYSTSGGSGSVGGPKLLEYFTEQGIQCVGVELSHHETLKHTTNTIGTRLGLEDAVDRLKRTIVVHTYENDPTVSPDINNRGPRFVLAALSMLNSGQNSGLDSADIGNMFNISKVTHHNPCLAQLVVFSDEAKLKEYQHPFVTLSALLKDKSSVMPQVPRDHGKAVYMSEDAGAQQSLFFGVSIKAMSKINEDLRKRMDSAIKRRTVSESTVKLGNGSSKSDKKTGLNMF